MAGRESLLLLFDGWRLLALFCRINFEGIVFDRLGYIGILLFAGGFFCLGVSIIGSRFVEDGRFGLGLARQLRREFFRPSR